MRTGTSVRRQLCHIIRRRREQAAVVVEMADSASAELDGVADRCARTGREVVEEISGRAGEWLDAATAAKTVCYWIC